MSERSLARKEPVTPKTREICGHPTRVIEIDGQPWLAINDTAQPCGFANNLARRLQEVDDDHKTVLDLRTERGPRSVVMLSFAAALFVTARSYTETGRRIAWALAELGDQYMSGGLAAATEEAAERVAAVDLVLLAMLGLKDIHGPLRRSVASVIQHQTKFHIGSTRPTQEEFDAWVARGGVVEVIDRIDRVGRRKERERLHVHQGFIESLRASTEAVKHDLLEVMQ